MSRRPASKSAEPTEALPNPRAVAMSAEELQEAVHGFYGTKTLLFDRTFAEKMLELNTGNRRFNARKLAQLVKQMASGTFENTGEPLIVSAEGVLNDGQHRLRAVVESGAVVDMDVRFGIPRKAFSKTDTGSGRTGGDVLTIQGVAGGAAVAAAVRLLVLFRRGLPDAVRDFVSNAEIADAFDQWKGMETVCKQVSGYNFPRGVRSTPLLATSFMASRGPSCGKLSDWLETLATGLAKGKSDPAYILRERLMRGVDAAVGTREGQLERFALMIMSWNAFAEGAGLTAKNFRWAATGKLAQPFPEVKGARL